MNNNFINDEWNALNILVQNASTVGLLDLKMLSLTDENNFTFFDKLDSNKFKFLYLLGSDNLEFKKSNEFIVYQGSHGDRGAELADVILPSAAFTEQNGLYSNLEGRVQECKKASYPIGDSQEDWKIFNLILKKLGKMESLNNFETLRKEAIESIVNFSQINELPNTIINKNEKIKSTFINEEIIIKRLDYYYTNSISRASKTMSECRQINNQTLKTGTNN
jgi:NADH-quinone oxidoreductase subunit G